MLYLTVAIIDGFAIDGFWNYVWATILIWVANLVVDGVGGRAARAST
jgi:uncharacterized membrane protein YvlD (DUF360 family)